MTLPVLECDVDKERYIYGNDGNLQEHLLYSMIVPPMFFTFFHCDLLKNM